MSTRMKYPAVSNWTVPDYLLQHCPAVWTTEGAKQALEEGFAVGTSGYTFLGNHYFAHGPFPGCLRGGEIDLDQHNKDGNTLWRKMTAKDLIIKHCFYPCPFMINVLARHGNKDFMNVDLFALMEFCINSEFTSDQLKYDNGIWLDYFELKAPAA